MRIKRITEAYSMQPSCKEVCTTKTDYSEDWTKCVAIPHEHTDECIVKIEFISSIVTYVSYK